MNNKLDISVVVPVSYTHLDVYKRQYLKRASRSEDEYAMALYNLGYCDFSRKDMAGARSSFEKFLEAYPVSYTHLVQRMLPETDLHGVRLDLRKVEDVRYQTQQLVAVGPVSYTHLLSYYANFPCFNRSLSPGRLRPAPACAPDLSLIHI